MKTAKIKRSARKPSRATPLRKTPTGIKGLDEITGGGLPWGRPTLVCGGAGSGKTLLAMEFLTRGAKVFGEPGVFVSFEEIAEDLLINFSSLDHHLEAMVAQKQLLLDFVSIDGSELEETGEYDLGGLFIRLGNAIDSIGAKRVVIDSIDALFSVLRNTVTLRSELFRLFRWLRTKGVTTIITAEKGEAGLTRHGIEEYAVDCVILLDNRVSEQVATRRLRVLKYRGSRHGTSEYPFLIDGGGISILPVTSLGLSYKASTERISSGVPRLDAMMGGQGYYRGSSVLVSGSAGTGKTSLAAHFAHASVARGERCLWFAFEESASQIIRNMRSIGIDLLPAVRSGTLRLEAIRPTTFNLEMHLVAIHKLVNEFKPRTLIIDPISNFLTIGSNTEFRAMLTRMIDFLKIGQITSLFTSLTTSSTWDDATNMGVSSLMDSWLLMRDLQSGAERNHVLHMMKSRGMAHSNQIREFLITDHGVELRDVYLSPSGVMLTGSSRLLQLAQEDSQAAERRQEEENRKSALENKRLAMEATISALRADLKIDHLDALRAIEQNRSRARIAAVSRTQMAKQRQADKVKPMDTMKPKPGGSR